MRRALTSLGCSLLLTGCVGLATSDGEGTPLTGTTSPTDPTNTGGLSCDTPTPGPAPLRRLSHVEYRYVVEDLFSNPALAQTVADTLVTDPVSLGFSNSASLLEVKPVLGQQYMEAAEQVALAVTGDLPKLTGCAATTMGDAACIRQFLQTFGRRVYRRSLSTEELQRYTTKYEALKTQYDVKTGIEFLVSTLLQSPQFLYRPELDEGMAPGTIRPVAPLELATRLSFLIWHSLPDAALIAAAEEGRLSSAADVEREARRLLADARGVRSLNFFEEWLDLDKTPFTRDATVFTGMPSNLPDLFRGEVRALLKSVVFDGDGRLPTLLTADYTFANDALARHYGLPAVAGSAFQRVSLPAGRRGLFMTGGALTAHDKERRTSIVLRGLKVRTGLMCNNVPSPPNDVSLNLGPVDATASQAQRLAQHRTDPSCSGCHGLLDPLGQPFENVDAVGRVRAQDEGGHAVDTSGEVTGSDDVNGTVASGVQLLERFAGSSQVRGCFSTQMFRYAAGREEQFKDGCSRKQAYDRFAASGYDIRELVVGMALSDGFRYRSVETQ